MSLVPAVSVLSADSCDTHQQPHTTTLVAGRRSNLDNASGCSRRRSSQPGETGLATFSADSGIGMRALVVLDVA